MFIFIFTLLNVFWSVLAYNMLKNICLDNIGSYNTHDRALCVLLSLFGIVSLIVPIVVLGIQWLEAKPKIIETR